MLLARRTIVVGMQDRTASINWIGVSQVLEYVFVAQASVMVVGHVFEQVAWLTL